MTNTDNPLDECHRLGCAKRAVLHVFMVGGDVGIMSVDGCREHIDEPLNAYYDYADGNEDVDVVVRIIGKPA